MRREAGSVVGHSLEHDSSLFHFLVEFKRQQLTDTHGSPNLPDSAAQPPQCGLPLFTSYTIPGAQTVEMPRSRPHRDSCVRSPSECSSRRGNRSVGSESADSRGSWPTERRVTRRGTRQGRARSGCSLLAGWGAPAQPVTTECVYRIWLKRIDCPSSN